LTSKAYNFSCYTSSQSLAPWTLCKYLSPTHSWLMYLYRICFAEQIWGYVQYKYDAGFYWTLAL